MGRTLCGTVLLFALALSVPASALGQTEKPISTLCIEAQTGLVLSKDHADLRRAPASMVKMMLFLLVAEGLRDGDWTPETPITATAHAQRMGGAQLRLAAGETWPLGRLVTAVAVGSANDAAMAVGEGLWGSEEAFIKRMNARAKELGMRDTVFHSVHGLPPDKGKDGDVTTARDMAILAQWCVLYPVIREWAGCKQFQFRPSDATRYNTNKLLWRMKDADGLKTGYTREAGFCVTATAVRDGVRLIAVVMGSKERSGRFTLAQQLLEDGFAQVRKVCLLRKGDLVDPAVPVLNSETESTKLALGDDLWVIVKADDVGRLEIAPQLPEVLQAPLKAGTSLGKVEVRLGAKALAGAPLVLPSDLPAAGWRRKLTDSVMGRHAKAIHPDYVSKTH